MNFSNAVNQTEAHEVSLNLENLDEEEIGRMRVESFEQLKCVLKNISKAEIDSQDENADIERYGFVVGKVFEDEPWKKHFVGLITDLNIQKGKRKNVLYQVKFNHHIH
jgi:hypothetical protein